MGAQASTPHVYGITVTCLLVLLAVSYYTSCTATLSPDPHDRAPRYIYNDGALAPHVDEQPGATEAYADTLDARRHDPLFTPLSS